MPDSKLKTLLVKWIRCKAIKKNTTPRGWASIKHNRTIFRVKRKWYGVHAWNRDSCFKCFLFEEKLISGAALVKGRLQLLYCSIVWSLKRSKQLQNPEQQLRHQTQQKKEGLRWWWVAKWLADATFKYCAHVSMSFDIVDLTHQQWKILNIKSYWSSFVELHSEVTVLSPRNHSFCPSFGRFISICFHSV